MEDKLLVLGSRGSMACSDTRLLKYGGATSAFWLKAGGKNIFFDAGTGLLRSTELMAEEQEMHVLIGHVHMDHIMGLAFWRPLFMPNKEVYIYSEQRDGMSIREQLDNFLRPPYWPVGIALWQGVKEYRDITVGETFDLGDGVTVSTMRSNHPNTSTIFRVDWDGKSVVYTLDYEHSEESGKELAAFAKDCDLIIYDSTYDPEVYPEKEGWGHSTWAEALKLKEAAGVKTMLLAHHEIDHTDTFLDALQNVLTELDKDVFLAKEGMEIAL